MKILIIQLARLGDIYQTWPVVRALKRNHPQAEIHLLTRQRFVEATLGLEALTKTWVLETREILSPLIDEKADIELSLARLNGLCEQLKKTGFTRLINLSFSPLSSYLTSSLASAEISVSGYTRHSDGWLAIPDDPSSYFYAQVGLGRFNRLHLTDVFAQIAQVELSLEDWHTGVAHPRHGILVHIGASQSLKTLSSHKWLQVVRGLLEQQNEPVTLVGSAAEKEIAAQVADMSGPRVPINRVGQTSLPELFQLMATTRLLVGGDSGPIHIASLVGTPVLNLSFQTVSFWETGPKSAGSRIIAVENEEALPSDSVVSEALALLSGLPSRLATVTVSSPLAAYATSAGSSFEWDLIQALYMGSRFPAPCSALFLDGVARMIEINTVALEQIQILKTQPTQSTAPEILNRVDEIMEAIVRMVPALSPLISWFQTERIRLGPMPLKQLMAQSEALHLKLHKILHLYHPERAEEGSNDELHMG